MSRKTKYSLLILLAFNIIYSVATGIYFLYMYKGNEFLKNVDSLFEGWFYIVSAIGILAVSFYMKGHYTKKRMLTAYSVSVISVVLISFLLFLPISKAAFTVILFTFFVLAGATQGCYVFLLTLFFPKANRCMGLGIAASLSVIINAALSLINDGLFVQTIYAVVLFFILAVLGCVLLMIAFKRYSFAELFPEADPFASHNAPVWNRKAFIFTCLFISLSWTIQSLGFFFPLNGSSVLGISSEMLRLTNILGLLIGGFIMSRDKRLGSISCLIILATPMLYIMLQAKAGITLLVFLLSYFFTGVLSIYRYGIIADLSDSENSNKTAMTYLCAFGLFFGRIGEGTGALLGIKYSSNTLLLLTITSFILVIAVAFFVLHYLKLFTPVPQIVQNHNDRMTSFKIKYGLSGREIDVLEFLLDDDSNAEIAEKLFVSENTIRFHVSNILKKTGCKNRKEISALFYK